MLRVCFLYLFLANFFNWMFTQKYSNSLIIKSIQIVTWGKSYIHDDDVKYKTYLCHKTMFREKKWNYYCIHSFVIVFFWYIDFVYAGRQRDNNKMILNFALRILVIVEDHIKEDFVSVLLYISLYTREIKNWPTRMY